MFENLLGKLKTNKRRRPVDPLYMDEFCLNCNADLRKQPGFSPELDRWVCRSCNQVLINPESEIYADSDVVWICDECGAILNEQPDFSDDVDAWECCKCGYENDIATGKVFYSETEYLEEKNDPTRGLSDAEILALSCYRDIKNLGEKQRVTLVEDPESGELYVKKVLDIFDVDVINTLRYNPIDGMPKILEVFQGKRFLTIIEEYVEGMSLADYLQLGPADAEVAKSIMLQLCNIVGRLHSFTPAIIHRDIKPDNIILTSGGKVVLLDINGAKVEKKNQRKDTVLFGTKEYAAPEQYGFQTSSVRTDIYALGVLLNVLLTGKYPSELTTDGAFAPVVIKCTKMDPADRYASVKELEADILER